jgi:uroporphyrinogen decarboxylase
MSKKEAVLNTLKHKQTNPVPYYLDLTEATLERMIRYTGDPDFFQNSGSYLEQRVNASFTDEGEGKLRDMFGVLWDKSSQEGDFGIINEFNLNGPEFGDYVFPEPDEPLIREKCRQLEQAGDKFTMYDIGFSLFERAWTLRSMPGVLMDMIDAPSFVDELLERIVAYNNAVVDIVAGYDVDCIYFGDDWGQQKGLIMGYPYWKRFIKPHLAKLYAHAKQKGFWVAQHACGDCISVFPDLVEMGLDIYNTFQPEVYDIVECKKQYGADLTFFGGISTQRLLPFATPAEVKKEMHRIMDILSVDGGYIIAPTHAMPNDIPEENVLAFLDVCRNENP